MYAFITGKLVYEDANGIVVENNGIGYAICVSSNAAVKFRAESGEIRVFTYLSVKEDEMSLYGFYSTEERDLFLKFISVSGVGAKTAIQILSGMRLDDLTLAIATGNVGAFAKIKGIGKKTAERIVLELKDKVSTLSPLFSAESVAIPSSVEQEAELALTSLGFTKAEARRAINAVENKNSVEAIIASALKRLN